MLKKIGLTAILSTTILFGTVMTASAESISDPSQDLAYETQSFYLVDGEWQQVSGEQLSQYMDINCFPNNPSDEVTGESQDDEQNAEEVPSYETPVEEPQEGQVEETGNESGQAAESLSQYEQEVVDLTNQEREKHGLSPLEVDVELSQVAREKSTDMAQNGYFSHNSPVYGSPFDMMQQFGITYQTAGENIAKGQQTPQEVVTGWMNSEGHRANILNADFTHIGVGYSEQGNHWTQQFIGK